MILLIYRLRGREVLHEDKEPRFVARDELPAASRDACKARLAVMLSKLRQNEYLAVSAVLYLSII